MVSKAEMLGIYAFGCGKPWYCPNMVLVNSVGYLRMSPPGVATC